MTQNTKLFWPDQIQGIELKDIAPEDVERYREQPVVIQTVKFDWLLEEISADNKQPYIYRLLSEIIKIDDMEFYKIPLMQALIRFHHSRL